MNALSQEARALIDSVSAFDEPSPADKARVRARLSAELGAAALATLALSAATEFGAAAALEAAAAKAVVKGSSWSLFGKLALSGAALSVVLGAFWFSAEQSKHAAPRSEAQRATHDVATASPLARSGAQDESAAFPSEVSHGTSAATDSVEARSALSAANGEVRGSVREQSAEPARAASGDLVRAREPARVDSPLARQGARFDPSADADRTRKAQASAPAPQPSPAATGTLSLELKLLGEAQAALRAGAPERALALAAEHQARFPEGTMKEERLGIEVLAGCALGRDYRAQAESFLKRASDSPLRARVQKACGIEP
jgi:hypothetical protein